MHVAPLIFSGGTRGGIGGGASGGASGDQKRLSIVIFLWTQKFQ